MLKIQLKYQNLPYHITLQNDTFSLPFPPLLCPKNKQKRKTILPCKFRLNYLLP